ncbi:MAG TPA: peptidase, partial [Rhodospirillaceae bacterium]|nr:peptidase [Rhodospirillaceae bacterium]
LAATAFGTAPARAADPAKVLDTYADIAHAMYEDALITAETLQGAIAQLVASPSRASLL